MAQTFRLRATKDEIISWEDAYGKQRQIIRRTRTATSKDRIALLALAADLAQSWDYVQVTTSRGADHLIRYHLGKVAYNAT